MIMNHDDDDEPRFYHPHPSHHLFLEPLVIGDSPATGQPPNPPRIHQKQQNYQIEGISHPLSSHLSWRKYSVIWRSFRLNTLIISAKWCFLWRECVQFVNKLYIWCGDEFSYNFVLCRQITISMYNMYTLYKVCSTCAVFQYSFKQPFRRICEWCKNLVPPRIHPKDKVAESSQRSSPLVEAGLV